MKTYYCDFINTDKKGTVSECLPLNSIMITSETNGEKIIHIEIEKHDVSVQGSDVVKCLKGSCVVLIREHLQGKILRAKFLESNSQIELLADELSQPSGQIRYIQNSARGTSGIVR